MNKNIKDISWSSARKICIIKTLAKSGHYPTRKSEKEAWFLSPLRSETQASFSVSLSKNLWYDYGLGKGGNIIDLVVALNNSSAFEAVQALQENVQFSFCPGKISNKRNSVDIREVHIIKHPALIEYLKFRNIPLGVAQSFCQEVWYILNNKEYFSIGLKNDSGGWELRNKYFKCSTSPKNISTITRGSKKLIVLEGMFDLLSLQVLEEQWILNSDLIVLNSLGNIRRITEIIKAYPEVFLYLDNDKAGRTTAKSLLLKYPHVKDNCELYKHYKDLNEKLKYEKDGKQK